MTNMIQPVAAQQLPQMYAQQQAGAYAQNPYMQAAPVAQQQPVYITSLSQLPQGAIPLSQSMMGQALTGTQLVQPPNKAGTIVGTVLKHAAIGAGVGAAVGLIPKLPPTMFMGAIIGAGVGAVTGVVAGIKKANAQEREYQTMAQGQTPAQPVDGNSAATAAPVTAAQTPAAASKPSKAKHPGAKSFKDGSGNIREIGTGKILKPAAKGAGTSTKPAAAAAAPMPTATLGLTPSANAAGTVPAANTAPAANSAPVAAAAPAAMGGVNFVDPSTQAPVILK